MTVIQIPKNSRRMNPVQKCNIIYALQTRFPGNNPGSWANNSNKKLLEWAKEYLDVEEVDDD